ncbi:hypothetical protein PHET_04603 [Paragonimus heterotremus]|uniref:Coiled-coil domain-containing protein n=1 Tax=Paragonimus heterotremus TaxID=100268 RepID=A0A8J4SPQ3_9TREM|nr:hypothetical protein PHET_04603 [Paragonimus heterotremus]
MKQHGKQSCRTASCIYNNKRNFNLDPAGFMDTRVSRRKEDYTRRASSASGRDFTSTVNASHHVAVTERCLSNVNNRKSVPTKSGNQTVLKNRSTQNIPDDPLKLRIAPSDRSSSSNCTEDLWNECAPRTHNRTKPAERGRTKQSSLSSSSRQGSSAEGNQSQELTAWAKWLLEKEKARRRENELKLEKRMKNRMLEAQVQALRAERRERAVARCKDWAENKRRLNVERKKAEQAIRHEQAIREKMCRENKKLEAERKYAQWMHNKEMEYKELKESKKQQEEMQALSTRSRTEAAQSAFARWVKSAKYRKEIPCWSYGYADGKVISYYDRTANPEPSFTNPKPWVGVLES